MDLQLSSTTFSRHLLVFKLAPQVAVSLPVGQEFDTQARITGEAGPLPDLTVRMRANSAAEWMVALPWSAAQALAKPDSSLSLLANDQWWSVAIPSDSLLRTNRRDLSFFSHQVRSPGSRKYDIPTTLFLAEEAYGWLPNDRGDRMSALIVMVYRLLDQPELQTAEQNTWLETEINWHLANSRGPHCNVDSRWGYSLRIAYFYWLLAHQGPDAAEAFMLEQHKQISDAFAMESVPNFFKMGLVLGTFALLNNKPSQVTRLLDAMNVMLRQDALWKTPVNFFQSLDRKNLIANYHEVFKLAIMLEPVRLKREWVSDHDMIIDTTFIGDPGRQLVRRLLQERGIKFK